MKRYLFHPNFPGGMIEHHGDNMNFSYRDPKYLIYGVWLFRRSNTDPGRWLYCEPDDNGDLIWNRPPALKVPAVHKLTVLLLNP